MKPEIFEKTVFDTFKCSCVVTLRHNFLIPVCEITKVHLNCFEIEVQIVPSP